MRGKVQEEKKVVIHGKGILSCRAVHLSCCTLLWSDYFFSRWQQQFLL